MSIGENVKVLRKRKGLTQGELAGAAGIQLTQVSRIENNDTDPKASTLIKVMKALDCSANDLFDSPEQKSGDLYFRALAKKISALTPLNKHIIKTVVDSFCRDHIQTATSSDYREVEEYIEKYGYDYEEYLTAMCYEEDLKEDSIVIEALQHETKEILNPKIEHEKNSK